MPLVNFQQRNDSWNLYEPIWSCPGQRKIDLQIGDKAHLKLESFTALTARVALPAFLTAEREVIVGNIVWW